MKEFYSPASRRLLKNISSASILALFTTSSFLAIQAHAQTTIWEGTVSPDWTNGLNWSTGTVPTLSDTVFINSNANNSPVFADPTGGITGLYIGSTIAGAGVGNGIGTLTLTRSVYAPSFRVSGDAYIGQGTGAHGTLVLNDAALEVGNNLFIGVNGATASVILSGLNLGSSIDVTGTTVIGSGLGSNATVSATEYANIYSSNGLYIGINGGTGNFIITGDAVQGFSPSIGSSNASVIGDGANSKGTLTINYANYYASNTLSVGTDTGTGVLNVLASGKQYQGSAQLTVSDTMTVGSTGGHGTLNLLQNGGANIFGNMVLGNGAGSQGIINIESGGLLVVSEFGGLNNGTVIGSNGGTGTLNISGIGSMGNRSGAELNRGFTVGQGLGSLGTVNVLASGKLSSLSGTQSGPGDILTRVGVDGGTGNVTVSGAQSGWYIGDTYYGSAVDTPADLYLGYSGNGTLTLADGGITSVGWVQRGQVLSSEGIYVYDIVDYGGTGTLYLAYQAGASGTLIFGAAPGQPAVAPGTLLAAGITIGAGDGTIIFNHTDGDYQFTIPVSGAGTIANYAGTTWLAADNSAFSGATNLYGGILGLENNASIGSSAVTVLGNATLAYNDAVSINNTIDIHSGFTLSALVAGGEATQNGVISGSGSFTKTGAGTLNLTGVNTYSGVTTIADGTLALIGGGSISQSRSVQVYGVFDIKAATYSPVMIKSLGGSGSVLLGDNSLTLSHAADTFSGVIQGNGGLNMAGGIEVLSGQNIFSGETVVSGGVLRAGATGTFSPYSLHSVLANGTLDLNGYSQTLPGLSNAGLVTLNGKPAGTVLSIRGNYIGNGGVLVLNTILDTDGSPSDKLVIDGGQASGSTRLRIKNTLGGGALTHNNGILVIEGINGGSTGSGTFVLDGRAAAGPYEYLLYHNGVNDSANDGNWYLRSDLPSGEPNYRVEAPLYMAVPPLAQRFGFTMLGTYHDRRGDTLSGQKADSSPLYGEAGWGRAFGETGDVKFNGVNRIATFEKNGPSYNIDMTGFQAGLDLYQRTTKDGIKDTFGIYVGAGQVDSDVTHVTGGRAGSASLEGYTVGAYWTRTAPSGWYLDVVAQGATYQRVKANSIQGQTLKTDGWGWEVSAETGYPIRLGSDWVLEPQAQLIYQRVSLDTAQDSFALINYEDTSTLYGRLGARLVKTWTLENNKKLITWAKANIWHGMGPDGAVTFSGLYGEGPTDLHMNLGGTWTQLGFGISANLADNINLFASGSYNVSLEKNQDTHSISGLVGINMKW